MVLYYGILTCVIKTWYCTENTNWVKTYVVINIATVGGCLMSLLYLSEIVEVHDDIEHESKFS